jgi:GNAT superfamily N-acetyltransferase
MKIANYHPKAVSAADPALATVRALALGREPETTRLVAAVDEDVPRGAKVWVAARGSEIGGALVVRRISLGRWTSVAFVVDPAAAPALAVALDGSRARALEGPADDLELLAPHLRRFRDLNVFPFVVLDGLVASVAPEQLDARSRFATAADLDAVTELYRGYELTTFRTRPALRRYLRGRIERGFLGVVEERGRLVAGAYCSALTDRYAIVTGLTALPEARGRGLGAALMPLAALRAREVGVDLIAVWAPTNGMRLKPERVARWTGAHRLGRWGQVALSPPPQRFRGERRLLRLLERLQGRVERRRAIYVTPHASGQET